MLFTHAVTFSSTQDYQIILEVTQNLRSFSGQNPALMGVQRLFEGIISVCKTVYEKSHAALDISGADVQAPLDRTGQSSTCTTSFSPVGEGEASLSISRAPFSHDALSDDLQPSNMLLTPEESQLIAELFRTQPSLGWIDSN